jgi:glycosyltransferase involved in cell wall biosynthesis
MRKWKPDILFSSSCMIAGVAPIAQKVDFPSLIYLGEPKRNLHEARPSNPWALPANGRAHGLAHRLRNMVTDISTCQGQRYQVTAEIRNARAFGRILVNSCFSRESVSRAYGLDSMVCYLGVDSTLFRPSSNARKPFVVGLGAFHEAKGIDRAIRAVGRVRPELRPDLVWIGNTPYGSAMADFTKLAAACGVQLRPFVRLPDDDLVEYLGTAALMLYTSRLEPFGFAPLEANACGTPVVGIAEGGVRETIRHGFNGFLAGNDDPDEIAAHMETLLENPGLASRMGADGRRFVEEEWNWGKAIDRLERNLFDVCAKNIPAHV